MLEFSGREIDGPPFVELWRRYGVNGLSIVWPPEDDPESFDDLVERLDARPLSDWPTRGKGTAASS